MRIANVAAIVRKELFELFRDRRALISMMVVPLFLFPLIVSIMTRLGPRIEQRAEDDLKNLGIAARVSDPSVRQALESLRLKISEPVDLKAAIQKKTAAAAVEEVNGTPPEFRIYLDEAEPASTAGAEQIRQALDAIRDRDIREVLQRSGISTGVLTPFTVTQTNVAGERKMAGLIWGSMLGYLLLLLMFTGGMYPIMDMTAGEKERKTMEALLVTPVARREIVIGKTVTAMISILVSVSLTLISLVISFKGGAGGGGSPQAQRIQAMMGTIPLDGSVVTLLALTLLPLAVFSASAMFAIALKARSFKEAQTYLTPLMLVVIFPALLGGIGGFKITPALCLIPIFNASQIIRGILLGDVSMFNFGLTMAANLVYAVIALWLATRMYEDENVLFRT